MGYRDDPIRKAGSIERAKDANSTPECGDHIPRMIRDLGWSPCEAACFARFPIDAQIIRLIRLDCEDALGARKLLDELEPYSLRPARSAR